MSLPTRVQKLEAKAAAATTIPCPQRPVRTPADVVDLLASQVELVRRDPRVEPVDKARTIALLASTALRAIKAAAGEDRLQAVERVLKLRRKQAREK